MSSETNSSEFIPSPSFKSGFETTSLLSSDAQTAFLSGNRFSEVIIPTPVPAHIRLPEYYTADQSTPPTPNFADYPLRVDGITIYGPQNDPRFPILAERFITINDLLSQKRKETELDRELLGIVHALQIFEFLIIGSPHPIHIFTDHKPLLHCFTKKSNLSPRFYRAQMQLTKFSKLKTIHSPGKNLSVAEMLSRSFTKAELQLNQLKHIQLPPQIDIALLQNGTLKPVHYLIKHEEIVPHQKYDSHPILADYGTDQFSIRINDKGNDIVVKPLQSVSFKSITPFQTKFKTPIKKNNKTLHQQSLLLDDTDITSDDEYHIYTRIPKPDSSFLHDTTLQTENYSALNKSTSNTSQKIVSAIYVQTNLPSLTHCPQNIPFYDTSFFKYKNHFQGLFLPDDYSLDITTLQ